MNELIRKEDFDLTFRASEYQSYIMVESNPNNAM